MHDLNEFSVLILPGLGGSGPDHWQTAWEKAFPGFKRVDQANWDQPVYAEWAARLTEAVARSARPVVLVAHSLGTSLTMRWSFDQPAAAAKVAGLLAPLRFQYALRALLGENAHEPLHARALPKAKQLALVNRNGDFLRNLEVPREPAEALKWGSLLLAILIKHDNSMRATRAGHFDEGQGTHGTGRK